MLRLQDTASGQQWETNKMCKLIVAFCSISVLLFVFSACTGCGNAKAQTTTDNSSLTIGPINLHGQIWGHDTGSALQVRSTLQGRTELQLIPNGVDSDGAGGELTIFNNDYIADPINTELLVIRGQPNVGFIMQVQSSGTGQQRPIVMDAMGGWPTFAVNPDGTVGIRRGISNTEYAGGFAHGRFASCSGLQCQTTISWQTGFGDTNYTATCTMEGAMGAVSILNKQASSMTVGVVHFTTGSSEQIDCTAVHD